MHVLTHYANLCTLSVACEREALIGTLCFRRSIGLLIGWVSELKPAGVTLHYLRIVEGVSQRGSKAYNTSVDMSQSDKSCDELVERSSLAIGEIVSSYYQVSHSMEELWRDSTQIKVSQLQKETM
eukprot:1372791-Amphidinium_carterae.1